MFINDGKLHVTVDQQKKVICNEKLVIFFVITCLIFIGPVANKET